ncbi:MAG: tetratricopeptide repeat protein [Clostridiales bacterium]|nr:tetratricopeptide repeat protein [Clostridiales bacterium]
MKDKKVMKIDFSRKRYAKLADQFYNEGKYIPALRLAYKELEEFGGDAETYARLCDIYEGMGLHGSAVRWWFRFLDIADEEDYPEIYEGLAVNFLNLGNEGQSAYYYNKLIDVDDTLPEEARMDIVEAFSTNKRERFRFVYPPKLADYSKEVNRGTKALKSGDCKRAVEEFSKVEKGSKDYASAMEMQAVAYLLAGDPNAAEQTCLTLLETVPDNIRAKATLAAVYLEQNRAEDSKALAEQLADLQLEDTDDLYKVATVCCENGLHEAAYKKFCILDKKMPYDGRMLYFKAVSAYKSGLIDESEKAFDTLVSVYPDAEVAKYYLREIRAYKNGETQTPPNLIYFYHLPQEEREHRCRAMLQMRKSPRDEAQLFGLLALHDGYFTWAFDEMDGGDQDLQYLALLTAEHVHADGFLIDVLLDPDVADIWKIEIIRMLLERNEEVEVGFVLCNIYRKVVLPRIQIGRKKRKKYLQAYAKTASKFVMIREENGEMIQEAAEKLYRALERYDSLDLIDNTDDVACAIYLMSGLKELGNNTDMIVSAFEANAAKVSVLMTVALSQELGLDKNGEIQNIEDKKNEID